MDANRLLENSLKKFGERFLALAPNHFSALKPVGDTIESICKLEGHEVAMFPVNLVRLAEAVIEVRKNPESPAALKDLPVLPYDLWLSFKVEGAPQVASEASDAAMQVFDEKMCELANVWKAFAESQIDESKNPDAQLQQFYARIHLQYHRCNGCFSEVVGEKLFNPTADAYAEFFESKIVTRVRSADDFKVFIICLNNVFYECLQASVKAWQSGQPVPDSLGQVAKPMEIIKGQSFRELKILRNKPVHNDSNALRTLAPIYNRLIGEGIGNRTVKAINPDNEEQWLSLQKAVLEMLASSLEDLRRAFG